jgi:hypothetical protein
MQVLLFGVGAEVPTIFESATKLLAEYTIDFVRNTQRAFASQNLELLSFFNVEPHTATEPVPAVAENAESPEMAWLVRNAQELGQYKGEWLLIHGQLLLVHSRNFATIREEVRQRRIALPFVYYVPTDQESNSVTI